MNNVLCITIFFAVIFRASCADITVKIVPKDQVDVEEYEYVELKCEVENSKDEKIIWQRVDGSMTISENEIMKTDSTLYSVICKDSNDVRTCTLAINGVTRHEHGSYKCMVKDKSATVNVHVKELPTPKPVSGADFTECCKQEKVSTDCLPACKPSARGANFDVAVCSSDIDKLVHCGSDGRNHVNCCARKRLNTKCYDICGPTQNKTFGVEYLHCLTRLEDIIDCFEEGQVSLPTKPTNLEITDKSETSLTVKWTQSNSKVDKKLVYFVHYRAARNLTYESKKAEENKYTINNLDKNHLYYIYVVAKGQHGFSLASNEIKDFTSGQVIIKDDVVMKDCCEKQGMSRECVSSLCTSEGERNPTGVLACHGYRKKFYQCLIKNGDHTSCCRRRGVTETCLNMCDGSLNVEDNYSNCQFWLPSVMSCVDEGGVTMPAIPMGVHVLNVKKTTADISWNTIKGISQFIISYYPLGSVTETKTVSTSKTTITLNNLYENSFYFVAVQAVNNSLRSFKSTEVSFQTNDENNLINPNPPPASKPYDEKKCCKANNVKDSCMKYCTYGLDLSNVDLPSLLPCVISKQFGTIISCGNAGRDNRRCCADRGVSRKCVSKCKYSESIDGKINWLLPENMCTADLPSMIDCMEEGTNNIPSAPRKLKLDQVKALTITIQWEYPEFLSGKIKQFGIFVNKRPSGIAEKNHHKFIIQNLKPNTHYNIYVIAESDKGSSLPSETISTRTLPGANSTYLSMNVSDCCIEEKVTSPCLDPCSGRVPLNLVQCSNHLDKILKCVSKKSKQTSDCCKKSNIGNCVSACDNGKTPGSGDEHPVLKCAPSSLKTYISCLNEGARFPDKPEGFTLIGKTQNTLEFSWVMSTDSNVTYNMYYTYLEGTANWEKLINITSPSTIKHLEPGTFYEVYLVAVNKYGESEKADFHLETLHDKSIPKIYITSKPKTIDEPIKEGSITLTCDATGYPKPNVTWKFADEDKGKREITFKISKVNQGTYTCVASNSNKQVQSSVYVKFMEKPQILQKPSFSRMVISEGEKYALGQINCSFYGWPKIVWLKNNREIIYTENYHLAETLRENRKKHITISTLHFQPILAGDNGKYTCRAKNELGSDQGDISLNIIEGNDDISKAFISCCKSVVSEKCKQDCGKIVNESPCGQQISKNYKCTSLVPASIPSDLKILSTEKCLKLTWKYPEKNSLVKKYEIELVKQRKRIKIFKSTKLQPSFCVGPNLEANAKYSVRVISYQITNRRTSSKIYDFTTPDKIPGKPTNIKQTTEKTVTFSWSPPVEYPYLVKNYKISYNLQKKSKKESQTLKEITVDFNVTSISLKLDPTKKYSFNIQSVGSKGSSPIKQVDVQPTQIDKLTKKKSSKTNTAAIVVPIIICLVVIVAAIGAFWWFRIRRQSCYSNSASDHTIAFENHGYGNLSSDGKAGILGDGY